MPIKDEFKKDLILGFSARPPIGIILGLIGFRYQVMPLMQTLSHKTRAYIVNADGLPVFVISIMQHLKAADEAGELEHAR